MKEMLISAWDILLRFSGAAGGVMGGGSIPLLIVFTGLDLLLSPFAGAHEGKTPFRVLLRGLMEKSAIVGMILLAGWMDGIGGKGNAMQNAVIGFYTCDEGLKLLKNAAVLGIPVPSLLRKAADALRPAE